MGRILITLLLTVCLINCQNQDAIKYFNDAFELENNEKYEDAIILLNKAILLDPKFEKAYLNRAINKSIVGEYESAIFDLNAVINLNDKTIEPYVWRAEYKRMLGRYESAMSDVEKALNLKKPIYDGTNIVGPKEFYINKLYPEGENFNIELEFIVFQRAVANYHLGNFEQALKDLEFCEQPETEPINTHYYKALTLLEFERIKEACEEMQKSYDSGIEEAKYILEEYCM